MKMKITVWNTLLQRYEEVENVKKVILMQSHEYIVIKNDDSYMKITPKVIHSISEK